MNTQQNNDEQQEQQDQSKKKGGIHNNALYAASLGRAATAQVRHQDNNPLAQTGTNIIYEGPTAPGSGGSAGTGYTSGQPGTGASISTDSDYEQAGLGGSSNQNVNDQSAQADDAERRDDQL